MTNGIILGVVGLFVIAISWFIANANRKVFPIIGLFIGEALSIFGVMLYLQEQSGNPHALGYAISFSGFVTLCIRYSFGKTSFGRIYNKPSIIKLIYLVIGLGLFVIGFII